MLLKFRRKGNEQDKYILTWNAGQLPTFQDASGIVDAADLIGDVVTSIAASGLTALTDAVLLIPEGGIRMWQTDQQIHISGFSDVEVVTHSELDASGFLTALTGVTSIQAELNPQLVGDVQFVAEGSVTLEQDGQEITVIGAAASGTGDGVPGGSNEQIQYNNGGLFGGAATLSYSEATARVIATKALDITNQLSPGETAEDATIIKTGGPNTIGLILRSEGSQNFGASAGSWGPSDVAGLRAWYDASATTSPGDGNPLSTWEDESGGGFNATQTGSARPTFHASILNSKPIVRFDDVDDYMSVGSTVLTDAMLNTNWIIFIVCKVAVQPNNDRKVLLASVKTGGTANHVRLAVHGDSNPKHNYLLRWNNGSNVSEPSTFFADDNDYHIFETSYSNPTIQHYVDGTDEGNQSANINPAGINDFYLGAYEGPAGASNLLEGDIAEIVIYNAAISEDDRQKVEGYLAHKWWGTGAANPLPINHVWKNNDPASEAPIDPPTLPPPSSVIFQIEAHDESIVAWIDTSGKIFGTGMDAQLQQINNTGWPVASGDAANKAYTENYTDAQLDSASVWLTPTVIHQNLIQPSSSTIGCLTLTPHAAATNPTFIVYDRNTNAMMQFEPLGTIAFNNGANDMKFVVKGSNDTELLVINSANTDQVGIGLTTPRPDAKLEIAGNIYAQNLFQSAQAYSGTGDPPVNKFKVSATEETMISVSGDAGKSEYWEADASGYYGIRFFSDYRTQGAHIEFDPTVHTLSISGLADPTVDSEVANKSYVDAQVATADAHTELTDMPDTSGINADHDARYYTKAEITASGFIAGNSIDYAYVTANDGATDVAATELETLTDTSDASSLHHHDGRYYTETEITASGFVAGTSIDYSYVTANDGATNVTAAELETLTDASEASALHHHTSLYIQRDPQTAGHNNISGHADAECLILTADAAQTTSIFEIWESSGGDILTIDPFGVIKINNAQVSSADFIIDGFTNTNVLDVDVGLERIGILTGAPEVELDVRGAVVFNNAAADYDFRVEGTSIPYLLHTDAKYNNVKIGMITDAFRGGALNVTASGNLTDYGHHEQAALRLQNPSAGLDYKVELQFVGWNMDVGYANAVIGYRTSDNASYEMGDLYFGTKTSTPNQAPEVHMFIRADGSIEASGAVIARSDLTVENDFIAKTIGSTEAFWVDNDLDIIHVHTDIETSGHIDIKAQTVTGTPNINIHAEPGSVPTAPYIKINDLACLASTGPALEITTRATTALKILDASSNNNIQFNTNGGMYLNFAQTGGAFMQVKGNTEAGLLYVACATDNVNVGHTQAGNGIFSVSPKDNISSIGEDDNSAIRILGNSASHAVGDRTELQFTGWQTNLEHAEATIGLETTSIVSGEKGHLYFSTRDTTGTTDSPTIRMYIKDSGETNLQDNTLELDASGTVTLGVVASGMVLTDASGSFSLSDLATHTASLHLENPVANEDITLMRFKRPAQILTVDAVIGAAFTNVVMNIHHDSDRNAAGTTLFTSNQTISSTSGTELTPAVGSGVIGADDWLWLETSSIAGSPLFLGLTIQFVYT